MASPGIAPGIVQPQKDGPITDFRSYFAKSNAVVGSRSGPSRGRIRRASNSHDARVRSILPRSSEPAGLPNPVSRSARTHLFCPTAAYSHE